MEKNLEQEKKHLKETIKKYKEIIETEELRIESLPRMYSNNPRLLASLLLQFKSKLQSIKKTIDKPYFARIDFINDQEKKEEECYIGKVGVSDEDTKIITVDWRAPIASLYYDSNVGKANYEAPEGIVTGSLTLKRQYEIEDGELKSYQDVDTVSNDEILKPYLGVNADSRLKNIVATIQAEQNKIIRNPLYKNLIIQGVAGSGKTTVALHRIAYLVYNYRENINPSQYLIIGPNKFFINYISNVLPDLDVNDVRQLTYAELVKDILGEDFTLIPDKEKLLKSIENPNSLFYERLKVSMVFKAALERYIAEFDKTIVPNEDFTIKGYGILPANYMKKIYNSINSETLSYNIIAKKIQRACLLISKHIEENRDGIMQLVRYQFYDNTKTMPKNEVIKERKKIDFIEKELRNNCNQSLRKYFSKGTPRILDLYIDFLNNINLYLNRSDLNIADSVKKNIQSIKKKELSFEDLASIIYLYYRVYGPNEYNNLKQVVIDEAQDFGEFNFYALKQLMPNATFSIFGDLAQSIYQYRGIEAWENIISSTFEDKCDLMFLSKSYRTTTEIMNSANNINKFLNLNIAEPVIRHGTEVNYQKFNNNQYILITDIINYYLSKKYNSIAIICKDEKEVLEISNNLHTLGIDAKTILDNDTEYNGGLCIITSYLAKGLEFDGVIIANASEKRYNSNKPIDMKLLYVAMTRPLHELNVLYDEEISLPLSNEARKLKL